MSTLCPFNRPCPVFFPCDKARRRPGRSVTGRCLGASIGEILLAEGNRTAVTDFYILGEANEGLEEGTVRHVEESLWSLQYSLPGVVASFFGDVSHCRGGAFDFAVMFRFSKPEVLRTFSNDLKFQSVWESAFLSNCQRHLTVVTQQCIPNELEAIFRKGQIYDEGYDHLMIMQLVDPSSQEAAIQFLSAVGDVSTDAEIGGVGWSLGWISDASERQLVGDLVLALRMGDSKGVQLLEQIPPVQQLWEEKGNGILKSTLHFSIQSPSVENP